MGAGHGRGRLVQTVFVGTCTYRSGRLLKYKGTSLTKSGDTERPVPEESSRPGSTLFVSFIYLFIFQYFIWIIFKGSSSPYVNIEFPVRCIL